MNAVPLQSQLVFAGPGTDPYGMPSPYVSYRVIAQSWQLPGSGVATVIPAAGDQAAPSQHLALTGGPEAALRKAEDHLRQVHSNLRLLRSGFIPAELVRSWVYGLLPALIEGLDNEELFLRYGSLTWRFRPQRCEYIQRLSEYLPMGAQGALAELAHYVPTTAERLQGHDRFLQAALASAAALHGHLVRSQVLQQFIAPITAEVPDWRGAYPPQDAENVLAECVVNWSRHATPQGYTTDRVWAAYRERILAVVGQVPQLVTALNAHHAAVDQLRQSSILAANALKSLRRSLCRDYGLPETPLSLYGATAPF